MFDAKKTKDACVKWIRDWFEQNGPGCNAVVGISGGKDSTVVSALLVEALGKDRVIGVLMPNGEQADISDSRALVEFLGIKSMEVNIAEAVNGVKNSLANATFINGGDAWNSIDISNQTIINLPPRIRMSTLYAISQSVNGRVANTCNKSEDWIGYSTKYGDQAGDFSPLSNLLVREVLQIGKELGLPENLIYKTPSDGLCGKTDEDNLGFSYATLDAYVADGVEPAPEIKAKIDRLHVQNLFKLQLMEAFDPSVVE